MKRIVLMGFMGAGKTTVGKSLARMLSCEFIDTDERIETEQGRKISDIFVKDGEQAFRDMETELLKRLQNSESDFVLSIGGGMPIREENRELLRKIGTVVYLKTSKEEIIRRVSGDTSRPLLQGGALEEKVTALMDAREEIYLQTAHREVITDGKYIADLVKEIEKIMKKHYSTRKAVSKTKKISILIGSLMIILVIILLYLGKKHLENEEERQKEILSAAYTAFIDEVNTSLPGIVCWGDSLTQGAGGEGITYPSVLDGQIRTNIIAKYSFEDKVDQDYLYLISTLNFELPKVPVINMGVGGETTDTIIGRNGAVPFVVDDSFIIPEGVDAVPIRFSSENGDKVAPLRQGSAGIQSVSINGVLGKIIIEQETNTSPNYSYYFERSEAGDAVMVESGTEIITSGSSQYLNYFPVIFMGQNGGYSSPEELIEQQRAILNHQTENSEKFIIVGLHTGTEESRAELENAMEAEYGDKYINLREYMCENGIKDANKLGFEIEPNEEDEEMMEKGMTPKSLLSDDVHFNKYGYELIGRLVYDRMDELGYFEEIKAVIGEN